MKKADITFENNTILLSGKLDFFNVMSVYQKSLNFIKANEVITIDCTHLEEANSATIALMIEWIKRAKEISAPVKFQGVSADIMAIAKAAGLDSIILDSAMFKA